MNYLFAALLAAGFWLGGPTRASPVRTPHLTAELVGETIGAAPGSTLYLAMVQTIEPGWHTYWRNPGDAGEATRLTWTLPAGWRAGEIVWPAPRHFRLGPIMNYGYEGRVVVAVPIEIPVTAAVGAKARIQARMDFLVCADVCVPGTATASLVLPVVSGTPAPDPKWSGPIATALAAAPKPAGLEAGFAIAGRGLRLAVAGAPVAGGRLGEAYFYPYDDKLIDQSAPESTELGPRGLTFGLVPGLEFQGGRTPASVAGVLVTDGGAYEIVAAPGALPAGTSGLGPPKARRAPLNLPLALAFGFLGGLILNLMPCVFPVLSMKAAALAGHGEAPDRARTEGLAFTVGVLATFLALAAVMIGARAAGTAVGWGFQLQSPPIVALLALVILAAALNLSGLFEAGASVQGIGAGLAAHGGLAGAFFTGMLAVVVAAPCTAPFMGPALGWALTASSAAALAVFAAVGVGFAAPFAVVAFSPALIRRLPGPGQWMEGFRRLLAFPMYGAAAWLAWVLTRQSGPSGLARLLAAAVTLSFAAWLLGAAQRRRALGRRATPILALAAAGLAASLLLAAGSAHAPPALARAPAGTSGVGALPAEAFTPSRLAALRAQGRPVLINFTAAWCVTCQVNERMVFSTSQVAEAFRRAGGTYLVADWTNRDPDIARALASEGRIGVPLYLVYGAGGGEPRILPQLLTPATVADAIEAAAVRPAAGSAGK
ncbi:MAG: protein-disulfide reductase DsbD family protein [Caulobacteraceae bacterium]